MSDSRDPLSGDMRIIMDDELGLCIVLLRLILSVLLFLWWWWWFLLLRALDRLLHLLPVLRTKKEAGNSSWKMGRSVGRLAAMV